MHPVLLGLVGLFVLSNGAQAPVPTPVSQIIPESNQAVSALSESSPLPGGETKKVAARSQDGALERYDVSLTAYNAVPGQTDGDPFTTASGAYSNPEVVAARSVDLAESLPFGTVVALTRTAGDSSWCNYSKVEHLIGYRVIADSMNSRIVNHVDVLLPTDETVSLDGRQVSAARAIGKCDQVEVRVVGYVDVSEIPDTQAELARLIEGTALARR